MKPRLFIDMDGTLAVWHNVYLEQLYEPEYFLTLRPLDHMISKISAFSHEGNAEVFLLSAYLADSKYALDEKEAWVKRYLPFVDEAHQIFLPCGENKAQYVPGGIRPTDFLLDDYTVNLNEWKQAGGTGIKLLNGINNTQTTWLRSGGLFLSCSAGEKETVANLTEMIDSVCVEQEENRLLDEPDIMSEAEPEAEPEMDDEMEI